jgi:hypothetical protein
MRDVQHCIRQKVSMRDDRYEEVPVSGRPNQVSDSGKLGATNPTLALR